MKLALNVGLLALCQYFRVSVFYFRVPVSQAKLAKPIWGGLASFFSAPFPAPVQWAPD